MKKIVIVGLGPGNEQYMTVEAKAALEEAELICGYTVYVDLVKDSYPDTPVLSTPMTKEIDRCKMALEHAEKGTTVAMVCSGDAGVYGMAGLIYQLSESYEAIEIVVVAGVTAALSGGAVLGAPLTHDFAVISLSDLLTPWETITNRLRAIGMGDFSAAIYNPCSKKRSDYLQKACDILLEYKTPDTVCGWVKNIGRDGQESKVLTLKELRTESLDMFTTVFVGNSQTMKIQGKMITPRGYENKK